MPVVEAVAQPGEGTLLMVKIATVFTQCAQIVEIDGPEILVEAIDKTVLNSGLIISRPSLFPEPDKVTLKALFDPNDTDTQLLFVTDFTTPKLVRDYKIVFNDTNTTHATSTFSGFLTSFKLNGMKVKSNIGADIELKLTTIPIFTPGTP
jgi:hypothetical protein